MLGKLARVLKAIGRLVNGAIKDMAADSPGHGVSHREDDKPPDW